MATVQTLYLHTGQRPGLSLGRVSTATPNAAVGSAGLGLILDDIAPAGGTAVQKGTNSLASVSQQKICLGSWASAPLAAQTIASGSWTCNLYGLEGNASANMFFSVTLAVYRPGTGIVGYLFDRPPTPTTDGTEFGITNTLETFSISVGSGFTVQDGDFLVFEVWAIGTQSMATAYAVQIGIDATGANSRIAAPSAITLLAPKLDQTHYRFRNDDGSESAATWLAALDTAANVPLDTIFRLRMSLANSTSVSMEDFNHSLKLQYSKNGGSYADVLGVGSHVTYADATGLSNGSATTEQISTGNALTFEGGLQVEASGGSSLILDAQRRTEYEFALNIPSATSADGDTFTFRVVGTDTNGNSPTTVATKTPSLTAGSGSTTRNVAPTGIATGEAFGSPTITSNDVVAPTGIATGEAFGSPSIKSNDVAAPTGIATGEAFGSPAITSGSVVVSTGIATAEAFGAPTFTGPQNYPVAPTGIATSEAFGSPTITFNDAAAPTGIATAEAFGSPTVTSGSSVAPSGVPTVEAVGAPSIVSGAVVSPAGISSGEAFGTPSIKFNTTVAPTGIATGEAFGSPVVSSGSSTSNVAPVGIATAEAFGTPSIVSGAAVAPTGIASGQAFGAPSVTSNDVVAPTGIASAGAFGTPTITFNATVAPTGIATGEAVGTPSIKFNTTVAPTGIATGEALGTVLIKSGNSVTTVGIPSGEAWPEITPSDTLVPSNTLLPAGIRISPAFLVAPVGIPSDSVFGTPTVVDTSSPFRYVNLNGLYPSDTLTPNDSLVPNGGFAIPSAEAFGTPTISFVSRVNPTGIPSAGAIGEPEIVFWTIGSHGPVGPPHKKLYPGIGHFPGHVLNLPQPVWTLKGVGVGNLILKGVTFRSILLVRGTAILRLLVVDPTDVAGKIIETVPFSSDTHRAILAPNRESVEYAGDEVTAFRSEPHVIVELVRE